MLSVRMFTMSVLIVTMTVLGVVTSGVVTIVPDAAATLEVSTVPAFDLTATKHARDWRDRDAYAVVSRRSDVSDQERFQRTDERANASSIISTRTSWAQMNGLCC